MYYYCAKICLGDRGSSQDRRANKQIEPFWDID